MVSLRPGTAALIWAYRFCSVNSARRIAPDQRPPISSIAAWNRTQTGCTSFMVSLPARPSADVAPERPQGLGHPDQLVEHGLGRRRHDLVRDQIVLLVDELVDEGDGDPLEDRGHLQRGDHLLDHLGGAGTR